MKINRAFSKQEMIFLFGYFILTYSYFVNIFDAQNDTDNSAHFVHSKITQFLYERVEYLFSKFSVHLGSFEGHSERFRVSRRQILWQQHLLENVTFIKITFSLLMDTNYKYSTFKQILDLRSTLRSISFLLLRTLQDQINIQDPTHGLAISYTGWILFYLIWLSRRCQIINSFFFLH